MHKLWTREFNVKTRPNSRLSVGNHLQMFRKFSLTCGRVGSRQPVHVAGNSPLTLNCARREPNQQARQPACLSCRGVRLILRHEPGWAGVVHLTAWARFGWPEKRLELGQSGLPALTGEPTAHTRIVYSISATMTPTHTKRASSVMSSKGVGKPASRPPIKMGGANSAPGAHHRLSSPPGPNSLLYSWLQVSTFHCASHPLKNYRLNLIFFWKWRRRRRQKSASRSRAELACPQLSLYLPLPFMTDAHCLGAPQEFGCGESKSARENGHALVALFWPTTMT